MFNSINDNDINNIHNYINDIYIKLNNTPIKKNKVNTTKIIKKTKNTSYSLEQFKRRQNNINFLKNRKKKNIKNFSVIEFDKNFEQTLLENDYKKDWKKLDLYQKKTKINEYLLNKINSNILDNDLKKKLYDKLLLLLKSNKLNKYIIYNKNKCVISCIENINFENKKFIFIK